MEDCVVKEIPVKEVPVGLDPRQATIWSLNTEYFIYPRIVE